MANQTGQLTLNEISIVEVDSDPSTGGGLSGAIGTLALLDDKTSGKMWIKSGSGVTAWSIIPRYANGTAFTQGVIPYADASGFFTSNATKLRFDETTGRLAIGNGAPATPVSTIHIDRGTGTGGHMRITLGATTGQTSTDGVEFGADDTGAAEIKQYESLPINFYTANTMALSINSTQRVIVGPGATSQDITGLGVFPPFQILGTSATQMVVGQYSTDIIPSVVNMIKSRGATVNSQGLLVADDEIGRLQYRGSDGVNFQAAASIRVAVDGTAAAGSMPGRLILMTTPTGTTTPVERLRIDNTGLAIYSQGIRLGNEASTVAGNIRYTGTDFEAYMAGGYRSITGAWISYEAVSTSAITTGSTTDVLVTGMTITPVAGQYVVNWNLEASATTNNRLITCSLYIGGTLVTDSNRQTFIRTGNATFTAADISRLVGSAKITVNGSQAVEMRWRTNGGTASAQGRSITLVEVGS